MTQSPASKSLAVTADSTLTSPSITAQEFALASKSEATRRAYRADWSTFVAWCDDNRQTSLPASPTIVSAFLAAQASAGFKPATLARRLAAINAVHRLADLPSPTTSEPVALVMSGIRRTVGVAPQQVRPLLTEDIRRMVAALPESLTGLRGRAIILLGFAAALRRSELVALTVGDIEYTEAGIVVTIRKSKTDQVAAGRQVGVPYGSSAATCPVRALRAWLEAADIQAGAIFRRIDQHGHIGPNALQPAAVAQVIKRSVEAVGLDASQFAGHSLRAGLATSAAQGGANEIMIMETTGHKSSAMVRRYVRTANLFRSNAATAAGL